jgi:hypothetical protein
LKPPLIIGEYNLIFLLHFCVRKKKEMKRIEVDGDCEQIEDKERKKTKYKTWMQLCVGIWAPFDIFSVVCPV